MKKLCLYFQVYGEFENVDGFEKFEFSHSYSDVHQPPEVIRPDGAFMSFEHYNVEIRKRVKCITAIEGKLFKKHSKFIF